MPDDRPDTVVLCGTFTRCPNVAGRLAAAGYAVVADPAADASAQAFTADGMRFVVCDADGCSPERVSAIVGAAAAAGARVLVVSASNDVEQIISCFRCGASDYLVASGPDDADRLIGRLQHLQAAGDRIGETLNRFVAKLQHDVKNPIGNILGYIDILREETDVPPTPDQADLLHRIESNCERALELLAQFAATARRIR